VEVCRGHLQSISKSTPTKRAYSHEQDVEFNLFNEELNYIKLGTHSYVWPTFLAAVRRPQNGYLKTGWINLVLKYT